jgi:hypothetical protein
MNDEMLDLMTMDLWTKVCANAIPKLGVEKASELADKAIAEFKKRFGEP